MPPWKLPPGLSEADIDRSGGFVYRVTHKATGRAYIGKKYAKMQVKRKWRPSRWRVYWGSSKTLAAEIAQLGHDAYEREIIAVYQTRAEVDYAEIETFFRLDVLRAKLPSGAPAFYNQAINARWFRAPK